MNHRIVLLIAIFLILLGFFYLANQPPQQPIPVQQNVLGVRTKTAGCVVQNGQPDKECTPGAVIPGVTKEQVCQPGYSKQVRDVSEALKNEVYREYGITTRQPRQYEIDHLISLELGGSNDIANLWPQEGFKKKDRLENLLHQQLCSGVITLEQAQEQIRRSF